MKKRSIKHLSLGKKTISTLKSNVFGGAPTTNQSQYCPANPLPDPIKHTDNREICVTRSCNSRCVLC
ncbi:hypothetical protein [Kordia sp.]|uniref:hypothetical protein n=1 Tax=Kordia sp. TaxID=1965332 RepID=UPI003B5A5925